MDVSILNIFDDKRNTELDAGSSKIHEVQSFYVSNK